MDPKTHTIELDGGFLLRGFWLYVWEVTAPDHEVPLIYVGRTGDSSSAKAQSPFNRMGQHLAFQKNSSMLRNHLGDHGVTPELCRFRLVSYGPFLEEVADMDAHKAPRDLVAAMEKRLAEDLTDAGYTVMNKVRSRKPLDEALYAEILPAFAAEFQLLGGKKD